MTDRCTTIVDAYRVYNELCGTESPPRTLVELRGYIHECGLRYEQLDSAFWDEMFESGWALNIEA